jgi:hypothetical protein
MLFFLRGKADEFKNDVSVQNDSSPLHKDGRKQE